MIDSTVTSPVPPWPIRWAVGMPVAAAASVVFFARAWGVPWHGYSVAAVAVTAWIFAVLAQWTFLRPGRERVAAAAALGLAGALVLYWAGWRLSRGLVAAALPVCGLAVFQSLLGLGRTHALPVQAAAVGGAAAAVLVVMGAPVDWPVWWRLALSATVLAGAVAVWREAGRLVVGEALLRLMRSVVFAAGVWLPLVWWRPGALVLEFARWENLAFLGLVVLVAWARPSGGGASRQVRWPALGLAGVAGAAWGLASVTGMESSRSVFLGVGAGALTLAALDFWPRSEAAPAAPAWWPEAALVVMALTTWIR